MTKKNNTTFTSSNLNIQSFYSTDSINKISRASQYLTPDDLNWEDFGYSQED